MNQTMTPDQIAAFVEAANQVRGFAARDFIFIIAIALLFGAPYLIFHFLKNGLLSGTDKQIRDRIFGTFEDYFKMTRRLAVVFTLVAGGFWIYKQVVDFESVVSQFKSVRAGLERDIAASQQQVQRLTQERDRILSQRSVVLYGTISNAADYDVFNAVSYDPMVMIRPLTIDNRRTWVFAIVFPGDQAASGSVIMDYQCVPTVGGVDCPTTRSDVRINLPSELRAGRSMEFVFVRETNTLRPRTMASN